jgi:large subunit ribosomal protein L21
MYAIVEIAGKQFRVSKDMKIKVPLLDIEPGRSVDFDRVLLFEDDKGDVRFGTPVIGDTSVSAKVIEHGRDPKVIVFKKKRRKGYKKKQGHRQDFSLIEITGIGAAKKVKAAPKAEEKAEVPAEKAAKKETAPKAEVKTKTTAPKAAKPKSAAVKTAVKKEPAAAKAKPAAKKTAAPKTKTAPAKKAAKPAAKKKDVKED